MPTSRPRTFDAPLSQSEFQNPSSRFGLAPFWFWNSDLCENNRARTGARHESRPRRRIFHSSASGHDVFTPHAFYGSSSGLRKFDAAPSFFEENPYWPHFGLLGDYAARLGLALSRGREVAPIALLYPTKRLWRRGKEDEKLWVELQNALLQGHFGFHIVDAPASELARARNGILFIGRARYETILVPPHDEGDEEIEACLETVLLGGVRVFEVSGATEALSFLEPLRALSIGDSDGRELRAVWNTWRQTPGVNSLKTALYFPAFAYALCTALAPVAKARNLLHYLTLNPHNWLSLVAKAKNRLHKPRVDLYKSKADLCLTNCMRQVYAYGNLRPAATRSTSFSSPTQAAKT